MAEKVEKTAPLDKIVLFSPHAVSLSDLPENFWEKEAEKLKKQGFVVVSSVLKPQDAVAGTVYIPLNCEEAFCLAYHCHAVYVLRSGFADLCFQLGDKLTVFYPTPESYAFFSMNAFYNRSDIIEKITENRQNEDIKRMYLFSKIRLFKTVKKEQDEMFLYSFYILFIPVLKIKKTSGKTMVRFFGIPVLKIKEKGG